ncbi:MAG: hypothetical protein RL153_1776, partial [Verrucomicrobiota bacterium]
MGTTVDAPRQLRYQPPIVGAFVYRLGHGPLKAERRVRFPYALPIAAGSPSGFFVMTRNICTRRPRPWTGLAVSLLLAATHLGSLPSLRADDASDVALEAVRRLKGMDLAANPSLRAAVENVADRLRGQPASVEVIRDFDLRSRAGHLVEFLRRHPEDAAAPDAIRYLARTDARLVATLLGEPTPPPALIQAVGKSGQADWNDRIESLLVGGSVPASLRAAALEALLQNEPGARRVAELAKKGGLQGALLD